MRSDLQRQHSPAAENSEVQNRSRCFSIESSFGANDIAERKCRETMTLPIVPSVTTAVVGKSELTAVKLP